LKGSRFKVQGSRFRVLGSEVHWFTNSRIPEFPNSQVLGYRKPTKER